MIRTLGAQWAIVRICKYIAVAHSTPRRFIHAHSPPSYTYRPLPSHQIRVIDLLPGREHAPIHCGIRHVPLQPEAHYESLSYCWGATKPETTIFCDDGVMPVTRNLYGALHQLRREHKERTLWVDAICINQSNVQERNYQVSLMKDIFQKSTSTVVWLGDEADDSTSAVRLITEMARIAPASSKPAGLLGVWNPDWYQRLPPLYDPAWRAFAKLLQCPWFHRAWIIQETSVTPKVMFRYGNAAIPWDDFFRALQYAVDLGMFIALGGGTTWQALTVLEARSRFQGGRLPTLLNTLIRNRSFQASDPRDKVFGLMSLADPNDVRRLGIRPDYHLSVDTLYKNVTMAFLEKLGLRALSASGVHKSGLAKELPSWVADWSVLDPTMPLNTSDVFAAEKKDNEPAENPPVFNPSSSTTFSPTFNHSQHLLGLDGVLVDEVLSVGELAQARYPMEVSHMYQLHLQAQDALDQLKNWERIAQVGSRGRYITGERRFNAYWQTLCAGRVPLGFASVFNDHRFKYYVVCRSMRHLVRFVVRVLPRSENNSWYNRFFYSLFLCTWRTLGLTPSKIQRLGFPPESRLSNHRRMIRTKKGYIGLAPRYTRVGDHIGVFAGGEMPLVVRKDGAHFLLVGESYVHGIMNGEAWVDDKVSRVWLK